jgi:hypothetical protein
MILVFLVADLRIRNERSNTAIDILKGVLSHGSEDNREAG